MANTFGGYPLYDAYEVRRHRRHYRYDDVPELEWANSLYVPRGRWPARGWLLMRRSEFNQLDPYTTHSLVIQDYGKRANTAENAAITFQNLSIVQARQISGGITSDPNSILLVEITDPRGTVWNEWFQIPTQSQYNIRSPAYPELFYSASMNGASNWNFSAMIGDLWGQMTALGTYPGLSSTPSWTPEGWSFPGESAWKAVCSILNYLGMTVAVDLTSATPYTIVDFDGADAANDTRFTTYEGVREDDWNYTDVGLGRVPRYVRVFFHRRNQYYGTEETVRRDAFQWSSTPLYSVLIDNVTNFPQATGTAGVWADFTVRYDVDNSPLAADVTTAGTIATTLANAYFRSIQKGTSKYLKRVYVGALPFTPGPQIEGVCWRHDYSVERKGWLTDVVMGPDPPFHQVRHGCPG